MNRRILRMVCALLTLSLLLGALPAMAKEEGKLGYVSSLQLAVYAAPAKGAKLLGTMSYGESLWVRAVRGDVAQVLNRGGDVGYCLRSGLTATDPNVLKKDAYAKSNGATIYERPDGNCATKVQAKAGAKLRVVAITPDGKWARVQHGGNFGYVPASQLSAEPVGQNVWIVCDTAVAVFDGENGNDAGVCSHGQRFELLGISGNKAHIRNAAGQDGWVAKEVISTTNPNTLNEVAYTQVGGRVFWRNTLFNDDSATLAKGTKVTVVSLTPDGLWARVRVKGTYGYILSILLDSAKPASTTPVLVCTLDGQDVYATQGISSKIVDKVAQGEPVRLLGVTANGHGLKVSTMRDVTGYVAAGGWTKK